MTETLSTLDLADLAGVRGGTTRDQYTRGVIFDYLKAGGPLATAQKVMDRVRFQLDSDPGNLDRYTNTIRSRPGGPDYLDAIARRDTYPH
jgi:hypothetical protein